MKRSGTKLGQNFLIDETACVRIAEALGDERERTVVEIGPGHGAITAHLATRCARLHCIEFDPALARELAFRFRNQPHVTVQHADILKTNLQDLLPEKEGTDASSEQTTGESSGFQAAESDAQEKRALALDLSDARGGETSPALKGGSLRPQFRGLKPTAPSTSKTLDVVGNLPYYITSDILLHLFAAARQGLLRRAILMMQREVAERVAAAPGSSDYGALSALTQLHADVAELFTLPPGAFSPPPDVFSTVMRLDFAPRFEELQVPFEAFNRFLRSTFAQKRKTLANNLRSAGFTAAQIASAWPAHMPPQVRSETVSLEDLALLYRSLRSLPSLEEPSPAGG